MLGALEAVTGEAGTGRMVLLAGEAGIGKTRLAQEVSVHAWERGFHVASGRCYEAQSGVPFYPFLEALGTLYEEAPEGARGRWPYLERLLPDHFPSRPTAAASGSQEELQKLLRAVNGFVREVAATSPVALFIDDLHWADEASLDLLQHLARHTRADRVLLVGTYRDVEVGRAHPLRKAVRDLGREQLVERVSRKSSGAGRDGRTDGRQVGWDGGVGGVRGAGVRPHRGQPLLRHRGAGGAHRTREPLRVGGTLGPQGDGSDRSPRKRARDHRRADLPPGAGSPGDAGGGERPGAEVRLRRPAGPLRPRRRGGGGSA